MSKLIDYVEFLIIALLIALCVYVGWQAFVSRPRVSAEAAAFEVAIANAAPTTIEILERDPLRLNHCASLTFCLRMIFSDLPSPAEAGFAKAGNRFPLFGIMR